MLNTKKERLLGQHLTPIEIFDEFILPTIKDKLYDFIWVDLFAGEGNLILPILDLIPQEKRMDFFKNHIFLADKDLNMCLKTIENVRNYCEDIEQIEDNVICQDSLALGMPKEVLKRSKDANKPIFHITNPPYLYIGYITKTKDCHDMLKYFKGENEGFQDLYQIALVNDLRARIKKLIYILPTNFLFGNSVSNKIRNFFLEFYGIDNAVIFEKQIFDNTGTNTMINFFTKKEQVSRGKVEFPAIKINNEIKEINYVLSPENNYRAGDRFDEFVKENKQFKPLKFHFHLSKDEITENLDDNGTLIKAVDSNTIKNGSYKIDEIKVCSDFTKKILNNILWVRTIDTGSNNGRVGLYSIKDSFQADCIYATKEYRTHPIQIIFDEEISVESQKQLMHYFNETLEQIRKETDSDFLTTYKYSKAEYIRKYLGLSQAKKLIETWKRE